MKVVSFHIGFKFTSHFQGRNRGKFDIQTQFVFFLPLQLLERTNNSFEESDSGATKSPLHLAVSETLWATWLVTNRS